MFNNLKKIFKHKEKQKVNITQNKPIIFEDMQGKDTVIQVKPNGNDSLFEIINLEDGYSILLNKEQCILVATALFEYGKTGKIIKTLSVLEEEPIKSEETNE